MAKIPREEIPYEEIYEHLDVKAKQEIIPLEKKEDSKAVNNPKIYQQKPLKYLDKKMFSIQDVHYCLDEHDFEFIRSKGDGVEINLDLFEFVIDRLEKEWHKILQNKINENFKKIEPVNICDICTFEETEENLMIVCQGCGISVHRDCYGSSYDKDEVFVCLGCFYHNKNPRCMFCPSKDGLMKMTTDCRWGHMTCVLFDESLDFDNPNSKEPIDIVKYKEHKGSCILCNDDFGTKVQCNYGLCPNLYHVSCGLDTFYFDMNNNVTYCSEHNPQRSKSIFSNHHNFFRNVVGYKKLSNPPTIRRKRPLSSPKSTFLKGILKLNPSVIPDESFFSLFKEESFKGKEKVLETVLSFWKHRKSLDRSFLLSFLRLKFDTVS